MRLPLTVLLPAVLSFSACDSMPGRPGPKPEVVRPGEILDFATLYKVNCSGCHGVDGNGSAAIALRNPVYLAIADEATLRTITSGGSPGTQMQPFAQSRGGTLTDKQIGVLVSGIWAWARPDASLNSGLPPYEASSAGEPVRGAGVYATFCSSCHGPNGEGGRGGSSLTNGTFLALVSDRYLRTITIAGRPELGAPDWRGDVPGRPMTDQEISDVVAWLASHRTQFPGQPYSASQGPTSGGLKP
jgi:cytochrome c oxidase cbb3-type subunit 3